MRKKVLVAMILCGLALGATAQEAGNTQVTSGEDKEASPAASKSREESITEAVIVYGTREEGYVTNWASNLGPLGNVPLIETPVSVYVMSDDLIDNLQVVAPDMLFKINPVLQFTNPQSRFFAWGSMRGFDVGTTARMDGIPLYDAWLSPDVEDIERVEVISGLSGFFNGAGNVAGSINYVRKRPTAQRHNSVTVGLNGGTNAYLKGDFGGMFDDEGRFGYRVNAIVQDGDTAVDHQSIERQFGSAAFDWNVTDNLLVQVDASYSDYEMRGSDVWWSPAGIPMPPAPDSDNFYGQPFSFTKTRHDHYGARLSWQINDTFRFRAAIEQNDAKLELLAVNGLFVPGEVGDFMTYAGQWKYPELDAVGGYAFLHANFQTGTLSHNLTTGYFGNNANRTNWLYAPGFWTFYPDVFNYSQPTPLVSPVPPPFPREDLYRASASRNDNFVIGDEIGIGDRWSALVGWNHSTIGERAFDVDGTTVIDSYDDSHVAPNYAVLFRINPTFSAYASYIEGLERGGTAGLDYNGVPVVNGGEQMAPLVSDQIEVGLKAQLPKAFFTAALFEINKGLEYYDDSDPAAPVYRQDGRQVHRGLELTYTGNVSDNLIFVAGFTFLDPELKDGVDPALAGNQPGLVAEQFGTLYAEYQLPVLPALTITGGAFYTGEVYYDVTNTDKLPSFVTFDLGARYETSFNDNPFVFRLNVTNITSEDYWQTGSILGAKRTLFVSASTSF